MMEVIANPRGTINGSQTLPMIVIIGDQVLARTCIVNILKRELTGFEIVEVTATSKRNGHARIMPEQTMADLTPREEHVLAALKLDLPTNLIAVRLNLSEKTVEMHIQHIMRKMLRWN